MKRMSWTTFVVMGEHDHEGHTLIGTFNNLSLAQHAADSKIGAYDSTIVYKTEVGRTLEDLFDAEVYRLVGNKTDVRHSTVTQCPKQAGLDCPAPCVHPCHWATHDINKVK